MRYWLCFSLLVLAGCVMGPSLQTQMASYIGATSQTLVQNLGVPDKQITINGIQYLAYDKHEVVVMPGPVLGPAWVGSPQVNEYSCETTFMLKDGRVFNFTMRGNDCG